MNDIEQPMGNAELRLTLNRIEENVGDVLKQATKTNGSVAKAMIDIENLKRWRTGLTYSWIAFTILMLPILGFTLLRVWDTPTLTTYQVQQASQQGVQKAFETQELQQITK